jgi:DNA replication protein DnaC
LGDILRGIALRSSTGEGSPTPRSLSNYEREELCPHGQRVRLYRYARSQPWQAENLCPECRRERIKARLYRASGISDTFWPGGEKEATFESFDLSLNPKMEGPLQKALRYCEGDAPPWLVLLGPKGNGKTHLSKAIAFTFLERLARVQFWVVPAFLDQLRSTFAPDSRRDFSEEMRRLAYEPELVVMDDYGAESATSWANERLYLVLNTRYEENLRTVITCNDSARLRSDGRIASRLSDTSVCQVVHCRGEDVRPKLRARRGRRCLSA